MRVFSALTIGLLSISVPINADVDNLVCELSGMAGVSFGQEIEQPAASAFDVTDSGVTYFSLEPSIDIRPFERLIVGVLPVLKQVFSIQLAKHGDAAELDRVIEVHKDALSEAHASASWRVIGNHHYGERIEGLDVALYRIGDIVDGEPTHLMSYDCDSRAHRKILFEK